jgi:hypothetical protein
MIIDEEYWPDADPLHPFLIEGNAFSITHQPDGTLFLEVNGKGRVLSLKEAQELTERLNEAAAEKKSFGLEIVESLKREPVKLNLHLEPLPNQASAQQMQELIRENAQQIQRLAKDKFR